VCKLLIKHYNTIESEEIKVNREIVFSKNKMRLISNLFELIKRKFVVVLLMFLWINLLIYQGRTTFERGSRKTSNRRRRTTKTSSKIQFLSAETEKNEWNFLGICWFSRTNQTITTFRTISNRKRYNPSIDSFASRRAYSPSISKNWFSQIIIRICLVESDCSKSFRITLGFSS